MAAVCHVVVKLLILINFGSLVAVEAGWFRKLRAVATNNVRVPRVDFVDVSKAGVPELFTNVEAIIRVRGSGFVQNLTKVGFTYENGEFGENCTDDEIIPYTQLQVLGSDSERITLKGIFQSGPTPQAPGTHSVYMCVKQDATTPWIHQGDAIKIYYTTLAKKKVDQMPGVGRTAEVTGLRAMGRVSVDENGVTAIQSQTETEIQLFGNHFTNQTIVSFTPAEGERGADCDELPTVTVVQILAGGQYMVRVRASLPGIGTKYYICVRESVRSGENVRWIHQGTESWLTIEAKGRVMPIWFQICLIVVLLILSGLFSGLNLGLMALDKTELRVIEVSGTVAERKCAKAIAPLRNHGNYLLCSLLLGNVLVNSSLTILMDDLTSGLVAVVGSTISIVIFGEIIPQAICSRHGLEIGARTLIVTKIFMFLTFPLSYPISKILDWVLGEEIGQVYDREKLIEYIKCTMDYNKLENEEVNIISGALELKKKTAGDIMTQIEDIFMLPYDAVLDFETVSHVIREGFSRIPVYDNGDRNNIVGLLNIKDLAFVDVEDKLPLKTVMEFYQHPVSFVFIDETLDSLLFEFKKGQSHLSLVRRVNTESDGDPFYEVCGLVTLEDVIEEILQIEIIDETDVLSDNRRKLKRKEAQMRQDFSDFAKISRHGKYVIAPQLALATFQYLSTSVEPFKRPYISESVLRRLMLQNIFYSIKIHGRDSKTLFKANRPCDYFVLILEGRVQVVVGKEALVFEAGPFTHFGMAAIYQPCSTPDCPRNSECGVTSGASPAPHDCHPIPEGPFTPDYTVEAIVDTIYMRVHRSVYTAAYRASRLDNNKRAPERMNTPLESEWQHLITAVNSAPQQSIEHLGGSHGTLAENSVHPGLGGATVDNRGAVVNAALLESIRSRDNSVVASPVSETARDSPRAANTPDGVVPPPQTKNATAPLLKGRSPSELNQDSMTPLLSGGSGGGESNVVAVDMANLDERSLFLPRPPQTDRGDVIS